MPSWKRRVCALLGLVGVAGAIGAVWLFSSSESVFKRFLDACKPVRAWRAGARFVTDKDVVLQSGANDCGPASLKMVLSAHGIYRSLPDLASDLRLTRRGTSMLDMRLVSTRLGLPAKSWAVQLRDLSRVPLPAIAYVYRNHFVVVRKFVTPGVLEVDDPALGKVLWPIRAFQKIWSGELLVFEVSWNPI